MNLRLRALEPSDASFLYRAENDLTVMAQSDNAAPYSQQMLLDYALNYNANPYQVGQLRLVVDDDEGTSIGIVDFYDISSRDHHAAIACMLLPQYRGMGIAPEMLKTATQYAIQIIGLSSLMALVHTDNIPSLKVFAKAGYINRGTLHKWHFSEGCLKDVAIMQYIST